LVGSTWLPLYFEDPEVPTRADAAYFKVWLYKSTVTGAPVFDCPRRYETGTCLEGLGSSSQLVEVSIRPTLAPHVLPLSRRLVERLTVYKEVYLEH
jgi:hypothetical protein